MAPQMAEITFDMRELEEELQRYYKNIKAYPLESLAEGMDAAVQDLLESEGRGQWPDFSPNTLKRHPKRRGGKLLQDLGQLKSMQHSTGPDWAQITSPAPYAGWHVTGTRRMPKRDFLDIDMGSVMEELAQAIADEVVE